METTLKSGQFIVEEWQFSSGVSAEEATAEISARPPNRRHVFSPDFTNITPIVLIGRRSYFIRVLPTDEAEIRRTPRLDRGSTPTEELIEPSFTVTVIGPTETSPQGSKRKTNYLILHETDINSDPRRPILTFLHATHWNGTKTDQTPTERKNPGIALPLPETEREPVAV